jgi:hypothetical protein
MTVVAQHLAVRERVGPANGRRRNVVILGTASGHKSIASAIMPVAFPLALALSAGSGKCPVLHQF